MWYLYLIMILIHSLLTILFKDVYPRVIVPVNQLVEVVLVFLVQKVLVKEQVGQYIPIINNIMFIIEL